MNDPYATGVTNPEVDQLAQRRAAAARQPRVGDRVHYVSYGTPGGEFGKACRAATVTEVGDSDPVPEHGVPYVGLCVLNPTGLFFHPLAAGGCRYDEGGVPDRTRPDVRAYPGGTWHWPEGGAGQ